MNRDRIKLFSFGFLCWLIGGLEVSLLDQDYALIIGFFSGVIIMTIAIAIGD